MPGRRHFLSRRMVPMLMLSRIALRKAGSQVEPEYSTMQAMNRINITPSTSSSAKAAQQQAHPPQASL